MLTTMYDAPASGWPAAGRRAEAVLRVRHRRRATHADQPDRQGVAGEWVYDEGCLSVPGLSFDIVRPKEIHLVGVDLDGNDVSFEADELLARLFQHELDHLDGILLLEHLDESQRKAALKELRRRTVQDIDALPEHRPGL
jgi:peptide deformylase